MRDFRLYNEFYQIVDDVTGESVKEPISTDLEVMYVGQAFGRKQNRKIDYRLTNHEKLQQIALRILKEGTNEEVLVIGIKIEVSDLATLFVNHAAIASSNIKLDYFNELQKRTSKRISEGQEITVFEASLINYFKPAYNKEYKESFPSADFRSYEEIYKTQFDYTGMTVSGIISLFFSIELSH